MDTARSNSDKTGKVYSSEYTDIPKVFFTAAMRRYEVTVQQKYSKNDFRPVSHQCDIPSNFFATMGANNNLLPNVAEQWPLAMRVACPPGTASPPHSTEDRQGRACKMLLVHARMQSTPKSSEVRVSLNLAIRS
jgi:hypothetical protein